MNNIHITKLLVNSLSTLGITLYLLPSILKSCRNSKCGLLCTRNRGNHYFISCAVFTSLYFCVPLYVKKKLFFRQEYNGPAFQFTLKQPIYQAKQSKNSVSHLKCSVLFENRWKTDKIFYFHLLKRHDGLGCIAGISVWIFYGKTQFVDSKELREMANLFVDLSIKCPTFSSGLGMGLILFGTFALFIPCIMTWL
jgi:hypothetical protein